MMNKLAMMALLGVSLLSAKTYTFTVTDAAHAGTAQLKPGQYTLKLDGSQVVLMDRRGHTIDTPTKVETADHKFSQTSILTSSANGANRIESIEFAGSKTKVIFE
jgi:hypothetical protein